MSEDRGEQRQALRDAVKSLSLVFQLGLSALCPILILTVAGLRLDMKYGNGHHWFTLAGVVCGIYSAYRGTWQMIRDGWGREKNLSPEQKDRENE